MEDKREAQEGFRILLLVILVWTVLVGGSLFWNMHVAKRQTRQLVENEAKANFNKDSAIRLWATNHGGCYVPIDDKTQPNPYLSHIPERDITTPSGRKLTLLNPAYLIRLMMSEYSELYGIKGRITSLKALNPINAPDEWEEKALTLFESRVQEVSEFTEMNGEPSFRYMKAFVTQKGCLRCHAQQGYKEGDIRGGIGIAIPLAPFLSIERETQKAMLMSHGLFYPIGLFVIALISRRASQRRIEKRCSEEALERSEERLKLATQAAHIGIWDWDVVKDELTWDDRMLSLYDIRREDFDGALSSWSRILSPEDRRLLETEIQAALRGEREFAAEFHISRRDGTRRFIKAQSRTIFEANGKPIRMIGTNTDITEEKLRVEQTSRSLREKETLLKEIHHRVKNNMAIMSSLLSLQARKIQDPSAKSLFEESQQRVKSMALVHEKLYQTKNLSAIPFKDYLESLITEISSLYRLEIPAVTTTVEMGNIELELETAVPLGLLLNELITNACKHAFPDKRPGTIRVHLTRNGDTFSLTVKDDGVGLPPGFDRERPKTLGLELVSILATQLEGTFQIRSDNGTEALVTFIDRRK